MLIKRRGVIEATPHRAFLLFLLVMVTRFVEKNGKWRRRNGIQSRACTCSLGREERKAFVVLNKLYDNTAQ